MGQGKTFGALIADARERRAQSQKELAALIKKEDGQPISPQYLNDIERDRRNPPSEHLIRQFAEALDIDVDRLCFAAGTVPSDLRHDVIRADPDSCNAAFKAFRRAIRRR